MTIDDNTLYGLTGAQMKDLPRKIPVITMQSTDPGEGVSLAANNFIAVYSAS